MAEPETQPKRNLGTSEQFARIILGIVLVFGFLSNFAPPPFNWVLLLLGVAAVLTGCVGICPVYSLFGINTYSPKKK